MSKPAIRVLDLCKAYPREGFLPWLGGLLGRSTPGQKALDGISFEFPAGAVVGVLGPNGAGKTTLLKCLLGLLAPSSGRVEILGVPDPRTHPAVRARLGAMVGRPAVLPYLTGRQNLELRSAFYPGSGARIDSLLDTVGLTQASRRPAAGYSTGMLQRLGLAGALLGDPELLVLDEPGNGLDPKGLSEVRSLIQVLARDRRRTLLVSSHQLPEVESVCDHLLVLAHGKLRAAGTRHELLAQGGSTRFEVDTTGGKAALALLGALPGCRSAVLRPPAPGDSRERILLEGDPDLGARIAPALVAAGHTLEALVPRPRSLEEFFLETVEGPPC